MNLDAIKQLVEIAQGITTITAIVVGGFWSYKIFIQKRQRYPRVKIEHHIICRSISSENRRTLLSLDVVISNSGDVLLSLQSGEIFIKQLLPLPDKILKPYNQGENLDGEQITGWKMIAFRAEKWESNKKKEPRMKRIMKALGISYPSGIEIEPGEIEQLHYDFFISNNVRSILVYSYFRNIQKSHRVGWSLTTTHDI